MFGHSGIRNHATKNQRDPDSHALPLLAPRRQRWQWRTSTLYNLKINLRPLTRKNRRFRPFSMLVSVFASLTWSFDRTPTYMCVYLMVMCDNILLKQRNNVFVHINSFQRLRLGKAVHKPATVSWLNVLLQM